MCGSEVLVHQYKHGASCHTTRQRVPLTMANTPKALHRAAKQPRNWVFGFVPYKNLARSLYTVATPRFCSPLGMPPEKSGTKLNCHIIPFPHICHGSTHRTCDTCGLCRKTDSVRSEASSGNFPPHKAWLPLYIPLPATQRYAR